MLSPREIIAQAWTITTQERELRRWGFFGSFFEILLDVKLLIYQAYFLWKFVILQDENTGLFDIEAILFHALPLWLFITLALAFCVLLLVEFIVPSLSQGAVIGLTAKAHAGEKSKGGLIMAMYNFFPLFAVHEIFVFTSLSMLVTVMSVLLRYGMGLRVPFMIVALIIWIVSNIIKFFSSFTAPAIVVDKLGVFTAANRSVKLVFSYLTHVMFLALLLLVISIRILINTLLIILLPAVIMGSGILLTHILSPAVSYSIATAIGVILTLVAAYFFAYLHVFREAVWTIMYMEVTAEKDVDHVR